jgi:transposase-like protein
MTRQGRYPQELRERAVRMVLEHQDEHPSQWAAICSIAAKFGISHETLRNWVRRAEVDDGLRPGLTSDERERLKSWSGRSGSCGGRMRSSSPRRFSSGRSSTADRADDRLHRCQQGPVRGRADLPGAADRPVHLLRRPTPAALGPPASRSGAEGRDPPGACRALRGLRHPESLAAAAPRRHRGGSLHRRAVDG